MELKYCVSALQVDDHIGTLLGARQKFKVEIYIFSEGGTKKIDCASSPAVLSGTLFKQNIDFTALCVLSIKNIFILNLALYSRAQLMIKDDANVGMNEPR